MASALVREMLDVGIHFGHHASRWNPKMKPYIYGKKNSIHIVDIRETLRGLLRAQTFVTKLVASGEDIVIVGTKRQAREAVKNHALRCGMHSVTERWLGGTLTNFRTIRSRLERMQELENLVASPAWETGYSKKMKSMLMRELEKIQKNLSGIRNMNRLPAAMVVIDVKREANAVREAQAVGIPTICLIDTDSDPDMASIPIPGNDDAMRCIELVVSRLADAVEEGRRARPAMKPDDGRGGDRDDRGDRDGGRGDGGGRRRFRRGDLGGGEGGGTPAPAPVVDAAPAPAAPSVDAAPSA